MGKHAAKELTLEQVIGALKRSPLFQLSLASKELFHSNFLAWLCEAYPQEAGKLFAEFIKKPLARDEGVAVDREHQIRERKNIDLWLRFQNGEELIIENKVKALATKQQLERTAQRRRGKGTSFLLLSLCRPNFKLGEWQYLSYATLLDKLSKIQPKVESRNRYHGELLQDYTNFIFYLEILARLSRIDWADDESDFFETDEVVEQLKPIKLYDLVLKRRYSELTSRIAESLRKNDFEVVEEKPKPLCNFRPGQVFVQSGFVKGRAFSAFRYVLTVDNFDRRQVMLDVEIQGHDFRLRISKAPEHIALRLWKPGAGKKGWFDFRPVQEYSDSSERPNKGRDPTFCKFARYGILYRYTRLKEISPTRLVKVFVKYAKSIRANEPILRDQVKT
jgi:hypothetical protein